MISLAPASLAALLLLGPPSGERPPVQTPKVSPTQPQPGEPAIAPAEVDSERATAEPAPGPEDPAGDPAVAPAETQPTPAETQPETQTQPQPETQPQPQPEGGLPSWQSEPVSPTDEPEAVDPWGAPVAPPKDPAPPRGAGLYAAAGGVLGFMITRQWVTALVCDDVYCGFRGNFDRVLGLGVMGLAAGGGTLDGRRAAYLRREAGEPPKRPTGRRAAGWTMFALGLGGLITDTVLYNLCYEQALGPYTQLEGFSYTCSPVASVVVTDFSTAIGATGIGLGMSAESQLRARKKLDLSVAPWGGRGRVGLSLAGRF